MDNWTQVKKLLVQGINENVFPGAVIRVIRDKEVVFRHTVGFSSLFPVNTTMTEDTVFDIASLTKVIVTTSAVMLLVQERRITLDDSISAHFPEIKSRDKKSITIRHLLSHSAGFNAWKPIYQEIEEEERRSGVKLTGTPGAKDFFLNSILRDPLIYEPGTKSIYSDLGFILLGFIIEMLSGEALDDFASNRIFTPLGMKSSFFVRNYAKKAKNLRVASTEHCKWRGRVISGEVHDENAWTLGGVAGHAGLFSNAKDIGIFAREVINSYHGDGKLFTKRIAHEFFKRQDIPSSSWVLGWDTPTPGSSSSGKYFSENSIGHTGFTGVSLWIDLKREIAVILLTNRIHPDRNNIKIREWRPRIHDAVMKALGYGS